MPLSSPVRSGAALQQEATSLYSLSIVMRYAKGLTNAQSPEVDMSRATLVQEE
jgi:hypothetical protein